MRPTFFTVLLNLDPILSVELRSGEYMIGRCPTCDIIIPHQAVSRRHAILTVTGQSITLTDLGSRNGTFVDGRRIREVSLDDVQMVTFGAVNCTLGDFLPQSNYDDRTGSRRNNGSDQLAETLGGLTSGQRRVFDRLLLGETEKQIAQRLNLSIHTVHTHVKAIYRQFGAHSRAEFFSKALVNNTNL